LSLLLHWSTLMVVRALPGAPPHDGIRLFLPAFGFWCVLAAIGAHTLFSAINTVKLPAPRRVLQSVLAASVLASAIDVVRYYPQTLSHYSLLVGGLRGATDKGMEPAYWWDALDNDVLRWLNERTLRDEAIAFSPVANVELLRGWGKADWRRVDPRRETFKWYVLQNRPGMFTRIDRTLVRREKPVYVKYAGRRRAQERVPSDMDVPLISVFSFEQYARARRR
jgi:hypothetical protein